MKTRLHFMSMAVAGVSAGLVGCATPPPESSGLSQADQVLRQASPNAAVALTITPPQVRVGDTIAMQTGSGQPGYLYVYQVGTDNKTLSMVFPNAMDGANYIGGGGVMASLPRPNWRITAKGPAGVGYFLAVVASKQQDLTKLAADVKEGRIAVDGPYGAAMATLREVGP